MPIALKKEEDAFKRSPTPSTGFKKLVPKVLRSTSMKNLFKSKKPRAPVDIVRETRDLLSYINTGADHADPKRDEKLEHLDANIRELKSILYGIDESEPVPEACAKITEEFFSGDTMRLLIMCLQKLNFEARKDATRVVANLQRQPVQAQLIASAYLEVNLDLIDQLITGLLGTDSITGVGAPIPVPNYDSDSDREWWRQGKWLELRSVGTPEDNREEWLNENEERVRSAEERLTAIHERLAVRKELDSDGEGGGGRYEDPVVALHFGGMLRECIRHQVVARYILKSEHMMKFFDYIQLPNFDVASDAAATFKELMTRHKSTVADFLTENYSWFLAEFNSKLLGSANYMTRRYAIKLTILLLLKISGMMLDLLSFLLMTTFRFQLLGDILLDRSNSGIMIRYVSSKDNMRVLMNLMRFPESHKSIQIDAFHVFKLFVANQNKPADIVNILFANRSKLLRFFEDFNMDKEDEVFEADKAQVIKEITDLEPTTPITCSGELFKSIVV
ncbi:hypothetical protein OROGR_000370 [Orobanche gracilis]